MPARVRAQRRSVVQGLLGLLGAAIAFTLGVGFAGEGWAFGNNPIFWPGIVCLLVVVAGLTANRLGRFVLAVVLLQIGTIAVATVMLLVQDTVGILTSLLLLVAPLIVTGLVLNRLALYVTAGISILIVLV